MADPSEIEVQFSEAIEFLRRRLQITSEEWRAIWAEAGGIAAEVADQQAAAVQRDLLKAVLKAIEEGTTLDAFRAEYDRIMAGAGWSDRDNAGWHSQLIFRLHTQTAYAAGRWDQAERLAEARPQTQYYWRYITAGDHRVRPQHQEWHGIILPREHPFWQTHFPPNGFNCRCHAQLVTDRSLRRYGWSVTPDDDPRLLVPPDPGWAVNVGLAGRRLEAVTAARPVDRVDA